MSIPPNAYTPDQVWFYLLVTVFAPDKAAADAIAQPSASDGVTQFWVAMDSIDAQLRLGIFGNYGLRVRVERGD